MLPFFEAELNQVSIDHLEILLEDSSKGGEEVIRFFAQNVRGDLLDHEETLRGFGNGSRGWRQSHDLFFVASGGREEFRGVDDSVEGEPLKGKLEFFMRSEFVLDDVLHFCLDAYLGGVKLPHPFISLDIIFRFPLSRAGKQKVEVHVRQGDFDIFRSNHLSLETLHDFCSLEQHPTQDKFRVRQSETSGVLRDRQEVIRLPDQLDVLYISKI